jgi:hypothetical protein
MFRNYLVNGTTFEEETVFFVKRVFFSKALPETSLYPKGIRRDVTINAAPICKVRDCCVQV